MELANATEFHFLKSCHSEASSVLSLKHFSLFSCFLALTVDLLSTVGILPFSGGYALNMIDFVCFSFGPRLLLTICSWLTPAVLFVLMNVTIISILLSSGYLESLSKSDSTSEIPSTTPQHQQVHTTSAATTSTTTSTTTTSTAASTATSTTTSHEEILVNSTKSTMLTRSASASARTTGKVHKVHKKVKRQYSSPASSMEKSRKEIQNAKSLGSSPLSAYNLITCEQDVFNEIIESYIDKFRQDMRQQEVQSMVTGHIFASSCPKW